MQARGFARAALLGAAVFLAAYCGDDDDDNGGPQPTADAGAQPPGGDGGQRPDGGAQPVDGGQRPDGGGDGDAGVTPPADGGEDGDAGVTPPADGGEDGDGGGTPPTDGGEGDGGVTPPTDGGVADGGTQQQRSSIRLIHAAPGAPAVDVYVAGTPTPAITNLAYAQTSPYLELDAGQYTFEVRAAGTPASAPPAFTSDAVTLAAGQRVTAIAAGIIGATDAAEAFRVIALAEEFQPAAQGQARVRVVHASADAPSVGIDVGNDGSVEVASLERFQATPAAGIDLPAGQPLQVGVTTVTPAAPLTAFTTPALPQAGPVFLIATGLLADAPRQQSGFGLLAVGPDGTIGTIQQNPAIFALHASPDAPAIDIFVGQREVADNVPFAALSQALRLPPGQATLDIFPHADGSARPAGNPVASASTGSLAPGEQYLGVATGFVGEGRTPALQFVNLVEGFVLTDQNRARVRAVHASPGTPAVDVGRVSGTTFTPIQGLTGLAYPNASASEGVALEPGTVTLGVAATGTTTPAVQGPVTLSAGERLFVVAIGALAPAARDQPLQLVIIDAQPSGWQVVPSAR